MSQYLHPVSPKKISKLANAVKGLIGLYYGEYDPKRKPEDFDIQKPDPRRLPDVKRWLAKCGRTPEQIETDVAGIHFKTVLEFQAWLKRVENRE